jgi:putative PIN family toxin of toxin-antitoxin system
MDEVVVLDTSVLVSGLRSRRGASYQLLLELGDERYEIAATVPLFVEYEKAVADLVQAGIADPADGEAILNYLATVAHHHEVFYLWRPMLKDPKDEMVLEAAVASRSRALVTHNIKDFRGSETFGVHVLTPGEFLRRVRRSR